MTPRVIEIKTNDDHTIDITFADGKKKKYDCNHLRNHGQFKIIDDIGKFHKALIDDIGGVAWDIDESVDSEVVWENRIDICKDVLYSDGKDYLDTIADEMFKTYDEVFKGLSQ